MIRSTVDLPQPEGPRRTRNSWSTTSRSKSRTASTGRIACRRPEGSPLPWLRPQHGVRIGLRRPDLGLVSHAQGLSSIRTFLPSLDSNVDASASAWQPGRASPRGEGPGRSRITPPDNRAGSGRIAVVEGLLAAPVRAPARPRHCPGRCRSGRRTRSSCRTTCSAGPDSVSANSCRLWCMERPTVESLTCDVEDEFWGRRKAQASGT